MKKVYSRFLTSLLAFLFFIAFSAEKLTAQSVVYDINSSGMLVNMTSNCGGGSYYNGCNGTTGFNFTSALPGGATITSVVLQLSVGVECQGGTRTTTFNNVAAPSFNTNNHCSCSGSGNGIFTLNLNPGNFVANGTNQFRIISPPSCFGLYSGNGSLPGSFARVTVNYTTGPPATPTSITSSSATICPGGSSTLTANGAVGTVYWFTSGCNTSGQIATGNPISVSPAVTTTYYARNYTGTYWSASCATSTVTIAASGAPNVTSTTIACGQTATLTASGGGGTYVWFTNANGTGQVGTGSSYTTPALTANTIYYVGLLSGGGGGGNVSTFTAAYAPANWTLSHLNGGNGSVNTGGAPNSIQLTGPNGTGGNSYTLYTIAVATSGTISFNWQVSHQDPTYDTFGYRINSTDYPLTTTSASGATSVNVTAGQTFAFYGRSHDGCCGTFTSTITNFVGPGAAAAQCLSNLATSTVTVTANVAQPVITGNTTVTCGNTTTLTSSSGNNTAWYSAAVNGNLLGTGANYTTPSLTANTTVYAVQATLNQGSATFNYTGGLQTWTVPAGVASITVDLQGAQGSDGYYGYGGNGGRLQAIYPVSAGQVLNIYVGNRTSSSTGGYNGGGNGNQYSGGGGGASDIRIGGTALSDRKLVTGGGGGGGYNCGGAGTNNGGGGGGTTGVTGYQCNSQTNYVGTGGTQAAGGSNLGGGGQAGSLGIGGNTSYPYGGGGGGGYYGGGAASYGGGGGGSSYADGTSTNVVHTQSYKAGNGLLTISWSGIGCSSQAVTVNVSVNAMQAPTVSGTTTFCSGAAITTTLTASGSPSGYTWWTNSNGTGQLGTTAAFTTPSINTTTTYYVQSTSPQGGSQTFNYTGGVQTFTAPVSGTYSFDLYGGRGGNVTSYYPTNGGLGGRSQGQMSLGAGQVINVYVGGQGADRQGNHPYGSCTLTNGGWNGGGANRSAGNGTPGGGASDIRIGGNALVNRYIVAGGGGGCGWTYATGGAGGGLSGVGGANGTGGGTQNAGGNVGNSSGGCGQSAGSLGQGGDGSGSSAGGGAGGGGYYGGGGGGYNQGGGGGSSYYGGAGVTNGSTQTGVRNGNGQIILTWTGTGCVSTVTPVTVTLSAGVAANAGADVTSDITCGKNVAQITAAALANGETGIWTVAGLGAGAVLPGSFSAATTPTDNFTGSYGGTYTLAWTVTNTATGCTSTDNMIVTFNQPNAASLGNLIGAGDVLWNGLATSDWSTSNNWYMRTATHYYRMTSGQPAFNTEVYTISNVVGGMCIGNNMPTLSVTSNAEDVYVNTGMSLNLTNDTINFMGNLTNHGTINASTGTINFTGGLSSLISGSGTTSLFNLTVNKSGGQALTISQPVTVIGVLDMTLGNIFTSNNNELTLGNSSAVPGTLFWTSGNIVGPFRRYFINGSTTGNAGLFPVGSAAYNRYTKVDFTSAPGVNQYLTVWYKTGAPLTTANIPLYNGLPLTTQDNQLIQNYSVDGYWNVDPTGGSYTSSITSAPYTMTLYANNLSGMVTPSITRIIKAPGSNNTQNHHVQWQGAGVHTPIAGGTSPVAFSITSTTMQGFSWFNIGTSNNQALPVELLSFSGTCANEQVDLTWQTASEHNSLSFDLEKSRDGEVWIVINTQAAAGNSAQLLTYSYSDKTALEGNNYYRLSQYDIDGASKVYDVINVNCSGSSKVYFSTYPNPTTGAFQVVLNNKDLLGTSILTVKDTKGSSILERTIDVKAGINLFSVQDLQLTPGIYYISIINGDKSTEVLKQSIR